MSGRDNFEDDEIDEFDEFDDADDDELFERESQEEDFEERMNRETEAYLKGVDAGGADAFGGVGFDPYNDEISDEERERFEEGYYDGYEEERDLDE
ncbi:hypothetical protein IJ768_02630 [Candidatus Saccharibacteria bacterium]|nr:hypothetical protein [Candidatus Saccharibacteria bacterium]